MKGLDGVKKKLRIEKEKNIKKLLVELKLVTEEEVEKIELLACSTNQTKKVNYFDFPGVKNELELNIRLHAKLND